MPSGKSTNILLENIRCTVKAGIQSINEYATSDKERRAEESYVQVLARVDRMIRGWGDAFSFVDNRLRFSQLDSKIDHILREFKGTTNRIYNSAVVDDDRRRRALGVALLKDTPKRTHKQEIADAIE